jgi:hypothetical protein
MGIQTALTTHSVTRLSNRRHQSSRGRLRRRRARCRRAPLHVVCQLNDMLRVLGQGKGEGRRAQRLHQVDEVVRTVLNHATLRVRGPLGDGLKVGLLLLLRRSGEECVAVCRFLGREVPGREFGRRPFEHAGVDGAGPVHSRRRLCAVHGTRVGRLDELEGVSVYQRWIPYWKVRQARHAVGHRPRYLVDHRRLCVDCMVVVEGSGLGPKLVALILAEVAVAGPEIPLGLLE